jgi:polyhydroxyalkanoate synthase subunit PhaC
MRHIFSLVHAALQYQFQFRYLGGVGYAQTMADSSQPPPFIDPEALTRWAEALAGGAADPLTAYQKALDGWGQLLAPLAKAGRDKIDPKDRRFAAPEWQHPAFALIRQGYSLMSDYMIGAVAEMDNLPAAEREKMRFAVQFLVDAMSPANSPLTNPVALQKAVATKGQSLMAGAAHVMNDLQRGQLTHTASDAFVLGENIAATPGKVVHETPLYQLIQYEPTTTDVLTTPLVIFPPWINRFYILDLTAEKSFIKYCVDQGITVFIVSWKSADTSMKDVIWDDYIAAEIDAIDTIRAGLNVPSVHAIGYCVAGTTLSAALAILAAKGDADKVKSATFFTAQVDFSEGGDLRHFVDEQQLQMIAALSSDGFLDGRYMSLTFNMLRGNDLIWSTVEKNYLLGEDYPAFDLLHWNGDVTNLPAKWHRSYLIDLYRDNLLVQPGRMSALGTPIDLTIVKTPSYIQAGKEDHIAPAVSVWKMQQHFSGPMKFVLAGSGHIAGVVNPPHQNKYQYWTNDTNTDSLDAFIAGATETKGSWWPDWLKWLEAHDASKVPAKKARIPGKGPLLAIEDAPGRYVKTR